MNRSPFASLVNTEDNLFYVHYSAVVCVEQADDGTLLVLRIGNNKETYKVGDHFANVLKELERARRAEIVSFGE